MASFNAPDIRPHAYANPGGQAISNAISQIPDNLQQGWENAQQRQIAQTRRSTLADLGAIASGDPDYAGASLRSAQGGDLQGAQSFATLALAQSRQAAQLKQNAINTDLKRQQLELMRQRAGKGENPTYGLSPIYGRDDAGNPVVMQPGTNGQMVRSQMPPGVTISQKPIQIDAGTHTVLIDPITRQPITQVPKNVAGAAQERAMGTAAGEARAALPGAEDMATQIGQQIDALANDPYLPSMVGPLASRLPNVSPEAARVQSRMDQLGGGAFLQARQMLKGQGAITDFESKRAEAAYARLNAAQSIEDYRAALAEFRDATTAGLAKLRQQGAMAPGGGQPPAAQGGGSAPAPRQPGSLAAGAVVNGFIYRGGNPKDPNSWGRAQ